MILFPVELTLNVPQAISRSRVATHVASENTIYIYMNIYIYDIWYDGCLSMCRSLCHSLWDIVIIESINWPRCELWLGLWHLPSTLALKYGICIYIYISHLYIGREWECIHSNLLFFCGFWRILIELQWFSLSNKDSLNFPERIFSKKN